MRTRRRTPPSRIVRPAEEHARGPRTFSHWAFVAAFTLIALGGLGWLLFGPEPDEGSVVLQVPQTLPDDAGDSTPRSTAPPTTRAAPGTTSLTTSTAAVGPRMPDGSPAPAGVTRVEVEGDTVLLRFGGAGGDDEGGLPAGWEARVAPASARAGADGESLVVEVGCAASSEERLAELALTEGDQTVTLAVAVVVPPAGEPCADGSASTLTLPLLEPLAGRVIAVVPPGTALSDVLGGG